VLPSNSDPALSLTVSNTAAPLYGLKVGLVWSFRHAARTGYFVYTYRSFSGR